jgi:hypothetical protein
MGRDRNITITDFSAGQTTTRAEKGYRLSKLKNVEIKNYGDSVSSISGFTENIVSPFTGLSTGGSIAKKKDFVLFYDSASSNIIVITNSLNINRISYTKSEAFELKDAAQIGEFEYVVIVTFDKKTEYIILNLKTNTQKEFKPRKAKPFVYTALVNIDQLDFIESSWCSDYGNAAKTYAETKVKLTGSIWEISKNKALVDAGISKIYYEGTIKIKFNVAATLSNEKLTVNNREISLVDSHIEIDGLRAIISSLDSLVENTAEATYTLTMSYVMIDVAQDDVKNVILTKIKFDFFKWYNPKRVSYVRDRLTFYDIDEDKNMYLASTAGSSNDFTLPRTVVNGIDAIIAVIGAEDFGTLLEITDYRNICFIGTKGIKSITSSKFTPTGVYELSSLYKGYINSFIATEDGIVAVVSDSFDFYKSTIIHISYATEYVNSDVSRLTIDTDLTVGVSNIRQVGSYSGFNRFICEKQTGGWVQFYLSIKDSIVFATEIELPAGNPFSIGTDINNIVLYNSRGVLFEDDSNAIRYFQYNKIPCCGKYLTPSVETDVPVIQDGDTGVIVGSDDVIVYKGDNNAFDIGSGRQKIKVGQTFLVGKFIRSDIIIDDIGVINPESSVFGEVTNINRVTLKFLNKSSGVVVNGDDSREKGFGFYEEHEAVVHTPMSNNEETTRVIINNNNFSYFEIRMIIIFEDVRGKI